MFKLFECVVLLHELGKLICSKEFFHPGLQRLRRNELNWKSYVGVDGRHPVLNISFYLGHTHADLLLEEFSDKPDTTGAEVINVILTRIWRYIEMNYVGNNNDKIRER